MTPTHWYTWSICLIPPTDKETQQWTSIKRPNNTFKWVAPVRTERAKKWNEIKTQGEGTRNVKIESAEASEAQPGRKKNSLDADHMGSGRGSSIVWRVSPPFYFIFREFRSSASRKSFGCGDVGKKEVESRNRACCCRGAYLCRFNF